VVLLEEVEVWDCALEVSSEAAEVALAEVAAVDFDFTFATVTSANTQASGFVRLLRLPTPPIATDGGNSTMKTSPLLHPAHSIQGFSEGP
jgi:hypothetical protein